MTATLLLFANYSLTVGAKNCIQAVGNKHQYLLGYNMVKVNGGWPAGHVI
jgi:hypothetical protein